MKRKLIIAGIFVALAGAMTVAVLLSNQNLTKAPRDSITFTPEGKLVVPQNEQARMTVMAEIPKGATAPVTNATPATPPSK